MADQLLTAAMEDRMTWKPISSAPRDGAEIWAYNGEQGVMRWIEGDGWALWIWADDLLSEVDPDPRQPTHWMPLPDPPKEIDDEMA